MKLDSQQLDSWTNDGYLILRNVLQKDVRKDVLAESMQAWRKVKGEFQDDASWLQNALLPNIHHHSPAVCRYYFDGPLVQIAEQLIGPNIKGATSQLTFKLRGNTQTFGWHQDNGYGELHPANAISTLTALDNVDQNNGCLWAIPGSHLEGQIDIADVYSAEDKAAGRPLDMSIQNASEAVPITMQAGDALVLHCHLLHRSEGNHSRDRDRRILFMRYADADAVERYNDDAPRLGPLLRGISRFNQVTDFEQELWNFDSGQA